MDMSYGSRGASRPWLKACKFVCGMQIVGGLVLAICSTAFLFNYSRLTGQVIGGLLIGVGTVGMYGSMKSHREALNLHLLGVLLAMMMAFNFLGQIIRETDVDCALAEMYVRGLATEELIKKQHETEIFNSLYTRMNEMEEMMHNVENGAFIRMKHKKEQDKLKNVDSDYIMAKMTMLHDHAEELAKTIMNHENISDPEHHKHWSHEEQEEVVRILDTCEKVIKRMRGLDEHGNETGQEHIEIDFEEYEEMLAELAALFGESKAGQLVFQGDASHLHQAQAELPNMRAAMDRLSTDEYHSMNFGTTGADLDALNKNAQLQQQRREKWLKEFKTELAKHKQANVLDLDLASLPEHCMVENKGKLIMTFAGFTALIAQVVSGYCVLSTLFKIPLKLE